MSLYPVRELLHPKVSMNHQARPPGDSSDRWSESTPRYRRDRSREYRAGLPIAARLPRRNEHRPAFSPSKLRNKNWTATRLIFHITAALLLGATGLLTLGPSTAWELNADEGKTVKVKVSFTGDDDNDESLTSVATATVSGAPNNPATGAPSITGTAQVGRRVRRILRASLTLTDWERNIQLPMAGRRCGVPPQARG